MTKQETKAEIDRLLIKWSERGLTEYDKIALKHLEANYKNIKESGVKKMNKLKIELDFENAKLLLNLLHERKEKMLRYETGFNTESMNRIENMIDKLSWEV